MMNAEFLEIYLHKHIPLSKAMGVEVLEATLDIVKLFAPLSPNINHRDTVFGGSASSVAILSAWSLLYLRLKNENIKSRIVIQRSMMDYKCPITDMFTASSVAPDPEAWSKFVATLRRKSRARVKVKSVLHCKDKKVGELEGEFVALDAQPS